MKRMVLALTSLLTATAFTDAAQPRAERPSPPTRDVAIFAPRPDYPYAARRQNIVGRGIARLEIDPSTGRVTHAYMEESTGSAILDDNTVNTFRHWRLPPGTVTRVRIPIDYTMQGEVITTVRVDAKPMDKVLAPFLGKGTVINGPMPQYPRSVPWTEKRGEGLYEVRVGANGVAIRAKVLKSSGDDIFDQTTVTALQNWRLRRGPMVIELPLSFHLTSTKYSVGIPKHP